MRHSLLTVGVFQRLFLALVVNAVLWVAVLWVVQP